MKNEMMTKAFEERDYKELYSLEDRYLKLSKELKRESEIENNELKRIQSKQFLELSDECARLADIVSWMAGAILSKQK